MCMHSNCFPARGVKFFKCVKCGQGSFNYANGVDICADCLDKDELCTICGKPMVDKKPISSEENTNIEDDIYSKKYNIYEILTLIPNLPKDTKFKCSLDEDINTWIITTNEDSLALTKDSFGYCHNYSGVLESEYSLKQILEATYTIVKPVEVKENKEKWVEIETHKDLCTAIANKKMIKLGDGKPTNEYNDKQIETLFGALSHGVFKIQYLNM